MDSLLIVCDINLLGKWAHRNIFTPNYLRLMNECNSLQGLNRDNEACVVKMFVYGDTVQLKRLFQINIYDNPFVQLAVM